MAAETIGRGKCPVCGGSKARFTVTKSQLACVTCNGCNFQGFARSDRSDELLRALIATEKPEPEPAPEPVRTAPAPEPAPEPVRTPSPPPATSSRPAMGWGVLG